MRSPHDREAHLTLAELLQDGVVPWAIADLQRELSVEQHLLEDVLADLERSGLIHRQGELIFASRAAVHFGRIVGDI
jgi:DNA-binding MarR family transcriptional regulator